MSNLNITPGAISHIEQMRAKKENAALNLRIAVEGGGCSGFQYQYSWDDKIGPDDTVYEDAVVTDSISLPFLQGSAIDYVVNLMGEDFKISNPNAASGCGCGVSFSV